MEFKKLPDTVKAGPSRALLKATEKYIRTLLGDQPEQEHGLYVMSSSMPNPPPVAGQWFLTVHPVATQGISQQANYIENDYSIGITLSVRTSTVPTDRTAKGWYLGDGQAADVEDWLIGATTIHGNYDLITAANAIMGGAGNGEQGFIKPLFFRSSVRQERGTDWWKAYTSGAAGHSVTMTFGGAKLVRGR